MTAPMSLCRASLQNSWVIVDGNGDIKCPMCNQTITPLCQVWGSRSHEFPEARSTTSQPFPVPSKADASTQTSHANDHANEHGDELLATLADAEELDDLDIWSQDTLVDGLGDRATGGSDRITIEGEEDEDVVDGYEGPHEGAHDDGVEPDLVEASLPFTRQSYPNDIVGKTPWDFGSAPP